MKRCYMCKKWKEESKFYKNRSKCDGLTSECKQCVKKRIQNYYKNNKEKRDEHNKKYRKEHPEVNKKATKKWYQKNKEKVKKYTQKYYRENKERLRPIRRENQKKRRQSSLKHKLNNIISSAVSHSLKGEKQGRHWESLVGYNLEDLIKHLEKQFTSEMSWDNYGSYWWVDHKIPISIFNFSKPEHEDFKRCWALHNLQPMEKFKNRQKQDKIGDSFQPSLKI